MGAMAAEYLYIVGAFPVLLIYCRLMLVLFIDCVATIAIAIIIVLYVGVIIIVFLLTLLTMTVTVKLLWLCAEVRGEMLLVLVWS